MREPGSRRHHVMVKDIVVVSDREGGVKGGIYGNGGLWSCVEASIPT